MKIKNLTKKKLLLANARPLFSLWDKTIGLLDKSSNSVVFKTRFGIHTFGLNAPIDILICDQNLTVVSIAKRLSPNRVYFWDFRYELVIESKYPLTVELGDKLKIYD